MQTLNTNFTLTALALLLPLTVTQAANIYEKDGTSLSVGGRVEAAWFSTHAAGNGASDSTIADRVRFGLKGRSRLYDGIYAFGSYELQWTHNGDSTEALSTSTRDMFVGLEFEKYGTLKAGRFLNHSYYIEELTDVFSWLAGGTGELNGTRNSGKLRYTYENYGLHVGAEIQTAVNSYGLYTSPLLDMPANARSENYNVNGGYSFTLGYTTPEILFGPVNLRAAYEYLRFQNGEGSNDSIYLHDAKSGGAGVSWGRFAKGLYIGGFYQQRHIKLKENPLADGGNIKERAYELVLSYGFNNGIYGTVGYEGFRKSSNLSRNISARTVPFELGWVLNPNFKIWFEGRFGTNSDRESGFRENIYTAGARYSF